MIGLNFTHCCCKSLTYGIVCHVYHMSFKNSTVIKYKDVTIWHPRSIHSPPSVWSTKGLTESWDLTILKHYLTWKKVSTIRMGGVSVRINFHVFFFSPSFCFLHKCLFLLGSVFLFLYRAVSTRILITRHPRIVHNVTSRSPRRRDCHNKQKYVEQVPIRSCTVY